MHVPGYVVGEILSRAPAIVAVATREADGCRVTLKILDHSDRARLEELAREGALLKALSHPNIVRVLDVGPAYIVLEHLVGRDLARILRTPDPLPVPIALRIAVDAARGLAAVHGSTDASGRPLAIVHRDVAPDNLFVTTDGTTKVIDFGIARSALPSRATATGIVRGKLGYISPERALGRPFDHRSDIFSLGVVLHELLSGRPLFPRTSVDAAVGIVVLPPARRPPLDPGLVSVLMRALARDPELRYASVAAMADDLERHGPIAHRSEVARVVARDASEVRVASSTWGDALDVAVSEAVRDSWDRALVER